VSYRGVLFDLDNTLVDRAAVVVRIAHALYDAESAIRAKTPRDAAVDRIVELDADGLLGRKLLMKQVLDQWPGIARSHEELVAWYGVRYVTALEEDPLVQALVAELSRASVPWGIVTNGPSSQHDKVALLGSEARPACVLVSGEFGYSKPAPEIFHEALRLLGLAAGRHVLFVGDNPDADIAGAQAVGMSTAWVRRGRAWPGGLQSPDHEVDHVSELAPYLSIDL
jgi:putative hydrolase of the HAD superfamily